MKVARLVCTASAVTMIAGWATGALACDKDKTSASAAGTVYQASVTGKAKTASTSATCSAEMAAHCSAEQAAACKAKMSADGASAVAASSSGAHDGASCGMKGMSATAASASDGCCAGKASASGASAKNGACAMKNSATAANMQSNAHGMGVVAASNAHGDCEACLDMTDCSDALDAIGAHRQAVRLKNGVMYVYTADSQRNVSAVQAAVARRNQHMAQFAVAGDKAKLCAECKSMRGAMASGKLTREVVNIEGGSLTLITSTDPTIVAKIHAMAEPKLAARIKS